MPGGIVHVSRRVAVLGTRISRGLVGQSQELVDGVWIIALSTAMMVVTTVRMRLWGPESGDALGLPGGAWLET